MTIIVFLASGHLHLPTNPSRTFYLSASHICEKSHENHSISKFVEFLSTALVSVLNKNKHKEFVNFQTIMHTVFSTIQSFKGLQSSSSAQIKDFWCFFIGTHCFPFLLLPQCYRQFAKNHVANKNVVTQSSSACTLLRIKIVKWILIGYRSYPKSYNSDLDDQYRRNSLYLNFNDLAKVQQVGFVEYSARRF